MYQNDIVPFPLSKLLAASVLNIGYASTTFKYAQNPNQFMFNTMLRAYSISNNPKQAFDLFNQMRTENVFLDEFTFVSTLKSCARESAIWFGYGIHSLVVKTGFDLFVNVKNTLLQFYGVRPVSVLGLFRELCRSDLVGVGVSTNRKKGRTQ